MNRWLFLLLVTITTALMGSSFAVGKIGLLYSSPLLLVALRFTIAGGIFAIIVAIMKRPHPKTFKQWRMMAIVGFFQTAGVMGCIFVALRTITSGETSILTFMNPLLVIVFGTIFLRVRYRRSQWIGVFIGFVGVFITLGAQLEFRIGTLLGLLSAVSWAISTLLVKTYGKQFDTWVLTAYQLLFGGILLLIASFILEEQAFVINPTSIFIVLWLAIAASIVQFAIWFYLLQNGNPEKTSAFLFLAPFFGVLFGWILLKEQLDWHTLLGGVLIISSIFIVNWEWKSKEQVGDFAKSHN